MEGDPDWSRLSKTSGIDLMALRTKYQNMKAQGLTQAGAGPGSVPVEYGGTKQVRDDYGVMREMPPPYATADEPPIPSVDEQTMKDAQERIEKLDMVHVCHICHGTGIETYEYMHMSRQRNCEREFTTHTLHCTTPHHAAWHGMAWYGMAWRDTAWRGMAQHDTTQHNTA